MFSLFTKHPKSVNETYLQHMRFSLKYSFKFILCAIAAFVHAIFPFLFTNYASKKVEYLIKWAKTRE